MAALCPVGSVHAEKSVSRTTSRVTGQGIRMTNTAGLADELIEVLWDQMPVVATVLGFRERDDQINDFSEAGEAGIRARLVDIARRATAIDPATLDATDRVTRAVVLQQVEESRDRID